MSNEKKLSKDELKFLDNWLLRLELQENEENTRALGLVRQLIGSSAQQPSEVKNGK